MIHKPQFLLKQCNSVISLFYYFITMYYQMFLLWSYINYLNVFLGIVNECIFLLFWTKKELINELLRSSYLMEHRS